MSRFHASCMELDANTLVGLEVAGTVDTIGEDVEGVALGQLVFDPLDFVGATSAGASECYSNGAKEFVLPDGSVPNLVLDGLLSFSERPKSRTGHNHLKSCFPPMKSYEHGRKYRERRGSRCNRDRKGELTQHSIRNGEDLLSVDRLIVSEDRLLVHARLHHLEHFLPHRFGDLAAMDIDCLGITTWSHKPPLHAYR